MTSKEPKEPPASSALGMGFTDRDINVMANAMMCTDDAPAVSIFQLCPFI